MGTGTVTDKTTGCLVGDCGRSIYARGMCRSCYESARRQIAAGRRTWDDLVRIGMALPARPLVRNPLTIALQQLDEGK